MPPSGALAVAERRTSCRPRRPGGPPRRKKKKVQFDGVDFHAGRTQRARRISHGDDEPSSRLPRASTSACGSGGLIAGSWRGGRRVILFPRTLAATPQKSTPPSSAPVDGVTEQKTARDPTRARRGPTGRLAGTVGRYAIVVYARGAGVKPPDERRQCIDSKKATLSGYAAWRTARSTCCSLGAESQVLITIRQHPGHARGMGLGGLRYSTRGTAPAQRGTTGARTRAWNGASRSHRTWKLTRRLTAKGSRAGGRSLRVITADQA